MNAVIRIEERDHLDVATAAAVRQLAAGVETADGFPPLSDDALMHLSDPSRLHLIVVEELAGMSGSPQAASSPLIGYAQLNGAVAEVAGRADDLDALLGKLETHSAELTVWSHGQRSPVGPAATVRGYETTRVLWQLRRPDTSTAVNVTYPEYAVPDGVIVRAFVPGQDDSAVLAVNAAAFANHPEQGGWTQRDLDDRIASDWFDANGLLLATRGKTERGRDDSDGSGELLGFHWTKLHPEMLGEVYVLAVAPSAQGTNIGRLLLDAGLSYLHNRGTSAVLLYVDDSNAGAIKLYERNGFAKYDKDVQLQRHS